MLIQAIFLLSGVKNDVPEAYTSCFFVVGHRKIMCWMLIQATFFFVGHREIICRMLIKAVFLSSGVEKSCVGCLNKRFFFYRSESKNHVLEAYTSCSFLAGVEKSFVEGLYKRFFCRWASKNHVLDAYTNCLFFVGRGKNICWMLFK